MDEKSKKSVYQRTMALLLFLLGIWSLPSFICRIGADDFYRGDEHIQAQLAGCVERWIKSTLTLREYHTGHDKLSSEWYMATYVFAGMGFGQTAIEHPARRVRNCQLMERCIEGILSDEARAYDKNAWEEDPLTGIDGPKHHAAYLGYFNLLLSLHRLLHERSKYDALNDRITAKLLRDIKKSPSMLLYTYPGQIYDVDNCVAIASIALHDRATGSSNREIIDRWIAKCRSDFIDPSTGLLYQTDGPPGRGSGTAFGLYCLSFADMNLSKSLYDALKTNLKGSFAGFGAVREFPGGRGAGDIDSGPVLLGYGLSATGFSIAGSRIHRDREFFRQLYATSTLFGAPSISGGKREYVLGGPLGNALMFAMLTALPDFDERIRRLDGK